MRRNEIGQLVNNGVSMFFKYKMNSMSTIVIYLPEHALAFVSKKRDCTLDCRIYDYDDEIDNYVERNLPNVCALIEVIAKKRIVDIIGRGDSNGHDDEMLEEYFR